MKTQKKVFWIVSIAALISQIGSGFSQVAVYGYLAKHSTSAQSFALAAFLAIVPALFSSKLAERLAKSFSLGTNLSLSHLLAALCTVLPIIGLKTQNLALLYVGEFVGSFIVGFSYPLLHQLTSQVFSKDELHLAAKIDTLLFSCNVIFGIGVASVVYNLVSNELFLLLDLLSYAIAFLLFISCKLLRDGTFFQSPRIDEGNTSVATEASTLKWFRTLNAQQRKAFFLQLFICLGCVATSTLLPSFAGKNETIKINNQYILSTAVCLVFARALGQLLAPLVISKTFVNKLAAWAWTPVACCFGFNLFYFLAIYGSSFSAKFILVVVAHFFSNVLYSTSVFAMQSEFRDSNVGTAFAKQYQAYILLSMPLPFLGGFVSDFFGALFVPVFSFVLFLIFFSFEFFTSHTTTPSATNSLQEGK